MYNNTNIIVEAVVFLPMLAAFVSYGIGRKNKDGRNIFADIIAGITLILCGILAVQTLTGAAGGSQPVMKSPMSAVWDCILA